jgi:hypothetical protein
MAQANLGRLLYLEGLGESAKPGYSPKMEYRRRSQRAMDKETTPSSEAIRETSRLSPEDAWGALLNLNPWASGLSHDTRSLSGPEIGKLCGASRPGLLLGTSGPTL